jgi:hypothetical protein
VSFPIATPRGLFSLNILGVVVGFAICAAGYSSARHFLVDKTIRLKRQNRAADAHGDHGAEEHH